MIYFLIPAFVSSFIITIVALIIYSIYKNYQLYDLRQEVLKNAREGELLNELIVRAKILKKYPNAYDYEKKMAKIAAVVFIIFLIIGTAALFLYKDKLDVASNKFFSDIPSLNGKEMNLYRDKDNRFTFMYSKNYKLENTNFGGIIYSELHRKVKLENPQKYNEVPNLQISFEVVPTLPKALPGEPDISFQKTRNGNKVVYIGEVVPSMMPNKHFFVMLNQGYLDISINPIFNSSSDDERLKQISTELEETVNNIIFTLEQK